MAKKYLKKRAPKRRKLGVGAVVASVPTALQYARSGVAYARQGLKVYKDAKGLYQSMRGKSSASQPKRRIAKVIKQGDNDSVMKTTVIGKVRNTSFE